MSYIGKETIEVFPSVKRAFTHPDNALFTEGKVAAIINKLIDTDGFVITPKTLTGEVDLSSSFEFDIFGYYFKVDKASTITATASSSDLNIYGTITLVVDNEFKELQGQDNLTTNKYEGISFSNSASVAPNTYSLLLMTRATVSSSWVVPDDSRIRFYFAGGEELEDRVDALEDTVASIPNTYLARTGGNVSGDITMLNDRTITGIPLPQGNTDVSSKGYVDSSISGLSSTYLKKNSDSELNMGNNKITNLSVPTFTGDAANKGYIDGLLNSYILNYDPIVAANATNFNMNSKRIINVSSAEADTDAINKSDLIRYAAPKYQYSSTDISVGSPLDSGTLYFVYEV